MVDEDATDAPTFGGRDLLELGGMLVGSVVGFTAFGLLADHFFDSSPVGALVGVALGIFFASAALVVRMRIALRDAARTPPYVGYGNSGLSDDDEY